ncbi:hypothetical protein PWT90_02058 [Aphanocladium album]|nr:hypothetical protein PWT90_02058 [Aphanocladium album]
MVAYEPGVVHTRNLGYTASQSSQLGVVGASLSSGDVDIVRSSSTTCCVLYILQDVAAHLDGAHRQPTPSHCRVRQSLPLVILRINFGGSKPLFVSPRHHLEPFALPSERWHHPTITKQPTHPNDAFELAAIPTEEQEATSNSSPAGLGPAPPEEQTTGRVFRDFFNSVSYVLETIPDSEAKRVILAQMPTVDSRINLISDRDANIRRFVLDRVFDRQSSFTKCQSYMASALLNETPGLSIEDQHSLMRFIYAIAYALRNGTLRNQAVHPSDPDRLYQLWHAQYHGFRSLKTYGKAMCGMGDSIFCQSMVQAAKNRAALDKKYQTDAIRERARQALCAFDYVFGEMHRQSDSTNPSFCNRLDFLAKSARSIQTSLPECTFTRLVVPVAAWPSFERTKQANERTRVCSAPSSFASHFSCVVLRLVSPQSLHLYGANLTMSSRPRSRRTCFAYNPNSFWGFETSRDRVRKRVIRVNLTEEIQNTSTDDIIAWNDQTGAGRSWSEKETNLSGSDFRDQVVVVGELIPTAARLGPRFPQKYKRRYFVRNSLREKLKWFTRDASEPVCLIVRFVNNSTNRFYILTHKVDGLCSLRAAPNQEESRYYTAFYDEWAGYKGGLTTKKIRNKVRDSLWEFCEQYCAQIRDQSVQTPAATPETEDKQESPPASGPKVESSRIPSPEPTIQTPPDNSKDDGRPLLESTNQSNQPDDDLVRVQDESTSVSLDTTLGLLFTTDVEYTASNAEELLRGMKGRCDFSNTDQAHILELMADLAMLVRSGGLQDRPVDPALRACVVAECESWGLADELRDIWEATQQFARAARFDGGSADSKESNGQTASPKPESVIHIN